MSDAIAGTHEDTAGGPAPASDAPRLDEAPTAAVEAEAADAQETAAQADDAEPATAAASGEAVVAAPGAVEAESPGQSDERGTVDTSEPGTVDPAAVEDSPQEASLERLAESPETEVLATEDGAADGAADGAPVVVDGAPVVGVASNAPATAVDAALASATPLAAAVARSGNRQRIQLRPSVTLGVFAVGILVGAVAWRLINVAPTAVEAFPTLPLAGEPPVAAVVAQHLAANDAQALSESLDQEVLDAIREQLNPLVTLERVTFVNAASLDDQILSAYVAEGMDSTGARGIVGLILVVRDGAVVAQ